MTRSVLGKLLYKMGYIQICPKCRRRAVGVDENVVQVAGYEKVASSLSSSQKKMIFVPMRIDDGHGIFLDGDNVCALLVFRESGVVELGSFICASLHKVFDANSAK